MKKISLSFGLIIAFAFYILLSSNRNPVAVAPITTDTTLAVNTTPSGQDIIPPKPVSPSANTVTPAATSNPISSGKYRDGTYTGSEADAYYGKIQVAATIQNGKISDVKFLQYPNDRANSLKVNGRAMPLLKSEAIAAQSAKVDGVSGATFTSGAFMLSLAAALAQATN